MLTVNQLLDVIRLDRELKRSGSALREDDLPPNTWRTNYSVSDPLDTEGLTQIAPQSST